MAAQRRVLALLTSSGKYLQEFLDNLARPNGLEAQFTYRRKYFDADGWKRLSDRSEVDALIVYVDAPDLKEKTDPGKDEVRFIPVRWVSNVRFDEDFEPTEENPDRLLGLTGTLGPLVRATEQDVSSFSDLYEPWRGGSYAPMVGVGISPRSERPRGAWRELAPTLSKARQLSKCLLFHVEDISTVPDPMKAEQAEPAEIVRGRGFELKAGATYSLSLLSYKSEEAKSAEIHISPVGSGLTVSQPNHRAIGQYKQESILVEVARSWDRRLTTLLLGRERGKDTTHDIAHIGLAIHVRAQSADLMIVGVGAGAVLAGIGQSTGQAWLTAIGTFVTGMTMWRNFRTFK